MITTMNMLQTYSKVIKLYLLSLVPLLLYLKIVDFKHKGQSILKIQ